MVREAIKYLFITIVLFVGVTVAKAATPTPRTLPQRLSIEVRPAYNIVSHYALSGAMTNGDRLESMMSLHARYAFSFRKDSRMGELFPTVYQGIGLGAYTLYHHNYVGTPLAIYVLQGAQIAEFSDKLSLDYEWNLGYSWGWRPNDAMNSKGNIIINIALPLIWHVAPKWEISLTPDFTHISNGDTSFSNNGANGFGLRFGASYLFNEEHANKATPRYFAPAEELKAAGFAQHITYDIIAYGGWRADRFIQDGSFVLINKALPIAGIQFTPLYQLNRYFALGMSLDAQVDSSLNLYDAVEDSAGNVISFERPSLWKQTEVGVSLRGEINAPIFKIGVGIGINLNRQGYDMSRLYTQFTLKAFIHKYLFLFVGYRFNAKAYTQNMMYGIGFRF